MPTMSKWVSPLNVSMNLFGAGHPPRYSLMYGTPVLTDYNQKMAVTWPCHTRVLSMHALQSVCSLRILLNAQLSVSKFQGNKACHRIQGEDTTSQRIHEPRDNLSWMPLMPCHCPQFWSCPNSIKQRAISYTRILLRLSISLSNLSGVLDQLCCLNC